MLIYVCHFSINCNAFQLINSRKNQSNSALLLYLSTILCIAQQNLSIGVNVVSKGSPSRILKVRRISLGITIRPRSSTRLTMPVAFIVYLSPFLVGEAFRLPRDGKPVPYNHFTNYAVSICK